MGGGKCVVLRQVTGSHVSKEEGSWQCKQRRGSLHVTGK